MSRGQGPVRREPPPAVLGDECPECGYPTALAAERPPEVRMRKAPASGEMRAAEVLMVPTRPSTAKMA